MRRVGWTDERLDEKMGSIDSTFEMLETEMHALRAENREQFTVLRQEIRDVRVDVGSLQRLLLQIAFGLIGGLVAALITVILALA